MFDRIAGAYDLNNRLHSLWRDQSWRRLAARAAAEPRAVGSGPAGAVAAQAAQEAGASMRWSVLDVACGTGDLAGMLATRMPGARIVGLDVSPAMLQRARRKFHGSTIHWVLGDATALPFGDGEFDAVTIAFGLRNLSNPVAGLREMVRVLRPGGRLVVLEFHPLRRRGPGGRLLRLYLQRIMPLTAGAIARDGGAYRYLATSVDGFMTAGELADAMRAAGLRDVSTRMLTFGIAALHVGVSRCG
jgi:demethylmenaquinone methyltransferase/2-methoxy-6-polyprenyl-1,4-benzoquinol methylase